jgi:molecular chaperone DnaJ
MRDASAAAAMRDYYEVLGVERDADAATIKRAFRSQARVLHPDVSDDPAAARRFGELSEAYGVLSKQSTRRLYDRFGYRGRGNGWFTPPRARTAGDQRRRRPRPVAEVRVDELEAARGVRRKVRWQRSESCSRCGGDGGAPGAESRTCSGCAGTGRRRVEAELSHGERLIQVEECPDCRGRGHAFSDACPACAGAGVRVVSDSADVHVPAGARDGDRLQLQDAARVVTVRVVAAPRDDPVVRVIALVGLAVALVLLILLLR